MQANAVFEGGGVKAIGLAGAAAAMEAAGYRWVYLAGTSAGALVAALLAAGYTGADLGRMLEEVDSRRFADRGRLPPAVALIRHWGLYRGRYLENWLRELLAARGVRQFGDLKSPGGAAGRQFGHRLQVIASDLTHRRLLVLPRDTARYGLSPDGLEVALAVRMSASIPFFYRPVVLRCSRSVIVDGGLLSNFPVWLFDQEGTPSHPTFGFRLVEPGYGRPAPINGPVSLTAAIVGTMLEAHDRRHLEERERVRTVDIPTLGVGTMEFDLSRARKRELFAAGQEAARRFLAKWDFRAYAARYCAP